MDITSSRYTSGNESGWTHCLDQSFVRIISRGLLSLQITEKGSYSGRRRRWWWRVHSVYHTVSSSIIVFLPVSNTTMSPKRQARPKSTAEKIKFHILMILPAPLFTPIQTQVLEWIYYYKCKIWFTIYLIN